MLIWNALIPTLHAVAQVFIPGEDYWTWTAQDGELYEDVEVLRIEGDEVTFRHKYGVATLERGTLPYRVQKSLNENVEVEAHDEPFNRDSPAPCLTFTTVLARK